MSGFHAPSSEPNRWRQFLALAALTAVETIRQPLCLLLTSACVLVTALNPMLVMFEFGEEGRLARDTGLACHFVFGVFVAGYAACSTLAREIRGGTAAAVLSKPVSRDTLFLAKFAGLAAVLAAFSASAGLATLMSERVAERFYDTPKLVAYVKDWRTGFLLLAAPLAAYALAGWLNWRRRRPFESAAFGSLLAALSVAFAVAGCFEPTGEPAFLRFHFDWRILPAAMLVTLALLIFAAMALGLSTRLGTVPTVSLCLAVLGLGLVSDYVFGRAAPGSAWAVLAYALVPNWQNFWLSDALASGGRIPWSYVGQAAVYAGVYAAAALALGLLSFRRVEVR
jgi:ABC-type transport system involved in multi-copper enzyme maturation permease subunit